MVLFSTKKVTKNFCVRTKINYKSIPAIFRLILLPNWASTTNNNNINNCLIVSS